MSSTIRGALLRWYDAHKRDLPWRRSRDPYAIWVSEIMLQQTRVDTVIPYWSRFLERFPTASDLAAASEDEVLGAWSGLGYYRRARLLHRGVREVVARYGGEVPEDRDARLSLPGVGRYTAGAIGSIAFDRPEPIVDGNVARVLCRTHRIESALGVAQTEQRLWAEAEALAVGQRPGDLNQALMELGATVCTPRAPRCDVCPIAAECRGRDIAEQLPVPRKKTAPKPVRLAAVIATRGDGVWLVRGEQELFGGLWSVPMIELVSEAATPARRPAERARAAQTSLFVDAQDEEAELAARRALVDHRVTARFGGLAGELDHVLSHRKLRVRVYRATNARAEEGEGRRLVPWAALDEGALGISKLTRKILALRS
jgi:A/G-specific adenine glycosylase